MHLRIGEIPKLRVGFAVLATATETWIRLILARATPRPVSVPTACTTQPASIVNNVAIIITGVLRKEHVAVAMNLICQSLKNGR